MKITTFKDPYCDEAVRFTANVHLPFEHVKDVASRSVLTFDLDVMAPTRAEAIKLMKLSLKKLGKDLLESKCKLIE